MRDALVQYGDIILAALEDPYIAAMQAQYREPPITTGGYASYDLLRRMAAKFIVAIVIETRITQVSEFAHRQKNPRAPGFEIVKREGEMTDADRKEANRIAAWLETCGDWTWAEKYSSHKIYRERLTFEYWLRQIMRDSLRYDQACTQIIYNKAGKPLCFLPIDGATIRINADASGYVQLLQNMPIVNFEAHEIGFGVRRARADIDALGYGYPELVELVDILTAFLWGFQYNVNYFRQGLNTKGVLVLTGPMNPEQLQTFRRDFQAMAMGVSAAHRIPILNMTTKESSAQWISLQRANSDMEYREWMNWLLKVICAMFLMDPMEIGFQFGAEGQRAAIYQTNPESRIQMGRDKGLRPLLRMVQSWINQWFVYRLNPEFRLEFRGIDDFAERERAAFDDQRVRTYMSVDEIRAEHNLPPLPGGVGKLPANPSLFQMIQFAVMNQVVSPEEIYGKAPPQEGGEEWSQEFEDKLSELTRPEVMQGLRDKILSKGVGHA